MRRRAADMRAGRAHARLAGFVGIALAIILAASAGSYAALEGLSESAYRALASEFREGADTALWEELSSRAPAAGAWLTVEGTPIDYPVAIETASTPRGFYLSHDIWGGRSATGCPYVDRRSDPDGTHVVVYGHRMGWSGRMFGALWDAFEQDAFDELGAALWLTPDQGTTRMRPLCALSVPERFAEIQVFDLAGTDVASFANKICEQASARSADWRSLADRARRILTLITCTEANGHSSTRTIVLFASVSEAG